MTRIPLLLAGLLAAVALVWAAHAVSPDQPSTEAHLAAAVEDLAAGQHLLQARLDRLEQARSRRLGPGLATGLPAGATVTEANARAMNPTAAAARLDATIQANDNDFRNETTGGGWSRQAEDEIEAALAPAALAAAKIPGPRSVDAQCRSRTCRVALGFTDETASEQANVYLLQALATTLPTAQTYYRSNPDGSVQMLVYAQRN